MKKLIALSLSLCSPVLAAEWVLVEDSEKYAIHFDKTSVTTSGQYKKAWFLIDFIQAKNMEKHPFQQFYSAKQLTYFDCNHKQYAMIQALLYGGRTGNGEVVDSVKLQVKPSLFEEVAPETIAEKMLNMICKHK